MSIDILRSSRRSININLFTYSNDNIILLSNAYSCNNVLNKLLNFRVSPFHFHPYSFALPSSSLLLNIYHDFSHDFPTTKKSLTTPRHNWENLETPRYTPKRTSDTLYLFVRQSACTRVSLSAISHLQKLRAPRIICRAARPLFLSPQSHTSAHRFLPPRVEINPRAACLIIHRNPIARESPSAARFSDWPRDAMHWIHAGIAQVYKYVSK